MQVIWEVGGCPVVFSVKGLLVYLSCRSSQKFHSTKSVSLACVSFPRVCGLTGESQQTSWKVLVLPPSIVKPRKLGKTR